MYSCNSPKQKKNKKQTRGDRTGVPQLDDARKGSLPRSKVKCSLFRNVTAKARPISTPTTGLSPVYEPPLPQCFRQLSGPNQHWALPICSDCPYCDDVQFPFEPPGFCCQSGRVKIDVPKMHPRLWDLFINDASPMGKTFRRCCRTYNNTMAFSSIACEQDGNLANNKVGAYTIKLQGIISHYIKNLIPKNGIARHAQRSWIIDQQNCGTIDDFELETTYHAYL